MKQAALTDVLEFLDKTRRIQMNQYNAEIEKYRTLLAKIRRELSFHGDDWAGLIEEIDEVMG